MVFIAFMLWARSFFGCIFHFRWFFYCFSFNVYFFLSPTHTHNLSFFSLFLAHFFRIPFFFSPYHSLYIAFFLFTTSTLNLLLPVEFILYVLLKSFNMRVHRNWSCWERLLCSRYRFNSIEICIQTHRTKLKSWDENEEFQIVKTATDAIRISTGDSINSFFESIMKMFHYQHWKFPKLLTIYFFSKPLKRTIYSQYFLCLPYNTQPTKIETKKNRISVNFFRLRNHSRKTELW